MEQENVDTIGAGGESVSGDNPVKPGSTVELKKDGETAVKAKVKTLDEQIAELDPNRDVWMPWDEGTKKGYLFALQNTKRLTEGKS